MFIEYMLVRESGQTMCPYWVLDGGQYHDPDTATFVGWTPNYGKREFYVPDSVVVLTREQVIARALGLHKRNPMVGADNTQLTDEQVTFMAATWCDSHTE